MSDDYERNADGSLTDEARKVVMEEFDRHFPHGTLCDCKECQARDEQRKREYYLANKDNPEEWG